MAVLVSIFILAYGMAVFHAPSGEYEAEYPTEWILRTDRADLWIANFPVEETPRGGLLPRKGASVGVSRKPESLSVGTPKEWADLIAQRNRADLVASSSRSIGDKTCIQQHYRSMIGPAVIYESWSCYLESQGRLYKIDVEYHLNDPNAARHREVWEQVVRTFRAIH